MTARAVADAVVAAIDAVRAGTAFRLDDVPNPRPMRYVEVNVERRFTDDGARDDGAVSLAAFRIYTTAIARLAADADLLAEKVAEALDFATIAVGSNSPTVVFETGDQPHPDDGRFAAVHTWTCVLPIESK